MSLLCLYYLTVMSGFRTPYTGQLIETKSRTVYIKHLARFSPICISIYLAKILHYGSSSLGSSVCIVPDYRLDDRGSIHGTGK
jgi:hypothetical protein